MGISGHDVWYTYTPTLGHLLVLSTSGSDFDTVVSVYTGPCEDLIEVACNDDASQGEPTSFLLESVSPGVEYRHPRRGARRQRGATPCSMSTAPR